MRAIEVQGVGKRYRLGQSVVTLREALPAVLRRGPTRDQDELWALRDVDLTVEEGETLGIVGSNGAGKSTLLKILARITEPTTGVSRTRGRVGAMLEVGTGFHYELTGRENIFLNGAILGLSRTEVRARMDAIVEFAEVERFLDTPLKRYSSGMWLRLAFAIAAEIQPEIIVVDEVLAVGDYEFQQRCLGRMSEMHDSGRTVLFVTHDSGMMARLCSRVMWLDHGRVIADGPTQEVLGAYLRKGGATGAEAELELAPDVDVGPIRVGVAGPDGQAPVRGEPLRFEVTLEARRPARGYNLAVFLVGDDGTRLLHEGWTDTEDSILSFEPGLTTVSVTVPPLFTPGSYAAILWFGTSYGVTQFEREVLHFQIEPRIDDKAESLRRARLVQPEVSWTIDRPGPLEGV
ncbi:MAG TPA: polysaccharide ABC transporter ATP-binding protein [Thermoleophilaceae bacterium]|nr:polysaccharide ABC transporter ATP-binding protein [Thermoleophilaceae bacterium]